MEVCKNCGTRLIEKATKKTAEQLKKPYYYTAYYYCPHCHKIYHNDKFKVVNQSPTSLFETTEKAGSFDVEIWTDGACINNGTPRARAAWAFVSGTTEKAGLVEGKQTNNVAEGLAIYHALVWAAGKGFKTIKLHTDSQISLFNLGKHHSLVKVNREIFQNIAEVIDKHNLQIKWVKVLGHSGEPNNDRVDKLANDLARSK